MKFKNKFSDKKSLNVFIGVIIIILSSSTIYSQEPSELIPSNNPSKIFLKDNQIKILYDENIIFEGNISDSIIYYTKTIVDSNNSIINQILTITSSDKPVKISGSISGSEESFPCEIERKRQGIEIVRHSFGLSQNLLNRAIYDRKSDWVLSIDYPAKTRIIPSKSLKNRNNFNIEIIGYEINIRFRPRYYQKHRGLNYFKPWEFSTWKEPIVGWCSWFAYYDDIDEKKIKNAADIISKELLPYGLQYIQIDDGYQQDPIGKPDNWLSANKKFPDGLENLCKYIKEKQIKPGIWTNVAFHDKSFVESNKNYFVLDEKGNPAYGRWIGYPMDGSNKNTINDLITPVYSKLKNMGWEYFKVDALRHLRYEGYNSNSYYFGNDKQKIENAFRNVALSIRNEIGRENFMLGCWGIRPELIGIIDGCRIGGDGFGFAGLSQYNSFNNIVWRNDPDHIELSEKEAYRSCMVTSLTGSVFMLTDKPEKYLTDAVEPAKRSVPTLFTLPGQIYDIDPSRSMNLKNVSSQLSGDGEREFDASLSSTCKLFSLELNTNYGNWVMLGRLDETNEIINFHDLGLSDNKEYLVFEFWTKQFLGTFLDKFIPGKINPKYNCQLFCIKEKTNHPQLMATNRHISCGALELTRLQWDNNTLNGESQVVGKDDYILYIIEPDDYKYLKFNCEGSDLLKSVKTGILREIHLISKESQKINWKIEYEKIGSDK